MLVICPASLRKQWAQELHDKFAVPTTVVDAVSLRKQSVGDMLATLQRMVGKAVVIMSYQFAAKLEAELRAVPWDVVVIDEAHKLRNAHRASNRTGQALKRALQGRKKLLLTATPLQNSLMELYGLSTLIDEHLFGDETAFRKQFMNSGTGQDELRERLASFAKRTLRRDVLEYIKYTERKALTQPFNPTDDEQALYERISAFLQKEDSFALPKQQRHLTGLILRKLLASSSHAVAATLVTIRERLQGLLTTDKTGDDGSQLVEQLIAEDDLEEDYLEEETSEAEDDSEDITSVPAEDGKPDAAKDTKAVRAAIGDYFMNALQGEKSWSYFIDWFTDNITNDDCKYILEYGILAATPLGLIYYSETVALYKEYWNEIWDIVLEDDITIQDCIREQDLRSATQFANHMVWAATEKLAFERLFNPKKIEYRRTTKW